MEILQQVTVYHGSTGTIDCGHQFPVWNPPNNIHVEKNDDGPPTTVVSFVDLFLFQQLTDLAITTPKWKRKILAAYSYSHCTRVVTVKKK